MDATSLPPDDCNHIRNATTIEFMAKPKHSSLTPDSQGRVAYRLREASALTGIPVSTFRTMARRGDLNPITGFGVWLISAEELEALLQKRLRNTRG
jgi:hypothetical protein